MSEQLLPETIAEFALAGVAVLVGLVILWAVVSIPVWFAAKVVTLGRAKFTRAMLVTAAGPIVYIIVGTGVFFITGGVLPAALGLAWSAAAAFILAFIAWIWVFKKGFDTGWLRALAIAAIATVVFAIVGAIITAALQAIVPEAPPITPFPSF